MQQRPIEDVLRSNGFGYNPEYTQKVSMEIDFMSFSELQLTIGALATMVKMLGEAELMGVDMKNTGTALLHVGELIEKLCAPNTMGIVDDLVEGRIKI